MAQGVPGSCGPATRVLFFPFLLVMVGLIFVAVSFLVLQLRNRLGNVRAKLNEVSHGQGDLTMEACIVIPARYASTRYPGKPLATLKGASGVQRSLIERSVMAGRLARPSCKSHLTKGCSHCANALRFCALDTSWGNGTGNAPHNLRRIEPYAGDRE